MLFSYIMSERLNRMTKEALDATTATLRALAEEASLHHTTLLRWSNMSAGVGARSAVKLADALERRGLRLLRIAARLRGQAEKGARDE